MATIRRLPLFLLLAVFGIACGEDDGGGLVEHPDPASILSFTADPTELEEPGMVTLRWQTLAATSIFLTQDGDLVDLGDAAIDEGSIELHLEADAVFELVASGEVGAPARESLTVTVGEALQPPAIASFSGPEVVGVDELGVASVNLSWEGVVRAEEMILEAEPGAAQEIDTAQTPDGNITVEITADTTFTLIVRNTAGEAREEVQVRIVPLPIIDAFDADRSWVGIDEEVTLSWETTHVTSVELWSEGIKNEDFDSTQVNGSFTLRVQFDTTFELRAYNEVGELTSRTTEVRVARPELIGFSGSAHGLWLGEKVSFSWESQGASSFTVTAEGIDDPICEVDDPSEVAIGGCEWEPPVGTFLVTGAAINASGVASDTWLVTVGTGPQIISFTIEPNEITLGDMLTLNWTVLPDPAGEAPHVTLVDNRSNTYPLDGAEEGFIRFPMESGLGEFEFTLIASTSHPSSVPVEATASITVHGVPTGTISVTPPVFDDSQFEDVVLSWTSEHAVSLVIFEVFEGETPVEFLVVPEDQLAVGEHRFVPQDDATYVMVGRNALDVTFTTDTELTMVPPEVLTFTVDKETVAVGEPVLLSWTTRMAENVSLSIFGGEYVRGENQEPFIDITEERGQHLPLTTDCSTSILSSGCVRLDFPGGFSFPFGGQNNPAVRIYSNGYLSFDVSHTTSSSSFNSQFPTSGTSNDHVHLAPFWDSLGWDAEKYPTGNIYFRHDFDPVEGESVIIQWKDATFSLARSASLNFQVILRQDGRFEYRYGVMDPGSPDQTHLGYVRGRSATIGYQTPGKTSSDNRQHNTTVNIWGQLPGRSFIYEPTPALAKNGSYLWYPYATHSPLVVSLEASRKGSSDSKTVSFNVVPRPEIEVIERPVDPMEIGTSFRLAWSTENATSLELVDSAGDRICAAADQGEVDTGFCEITENEEGFFTYWFRVGGQMGMSTEAPVTVAYYEPFSIESFTIDKEIVEHGDSVTLDWVTVNAQQISLLANGVELLPSGAPSGPGSLEVMDVTVDTTFVLRLTNSIGMVQEATQKIETWRVRLTMTPSQTQVRPGEEVTITIKAEAVDGGPTPEIWGSFPLIEVENPSPYSDISSHPTAAQLATIGAAPEFPQIYYGDIDLPTGFTFPYFGQSFGRIRIYNHGVVSFEPTDDHNANVNNQILPTNSAAYNRFHLAPLWDNLRPVGAGAGIWTAQPDPDTFIIQWTKFSHTNGSWKEETIDGNKVILEAPFNLNFQVALFRDGTFEYRYGTMDPPAEPFSGCQPASCVGEANGSSATIGYHARRGLFGYTHHFGGTNNNAANPMLPGGTANRTFRYVPVPNGGQMKFNPVRTTTYTICAMSGSVPVCKHQEIDASFGILSFGPDSDSINFNESTFLRWTTVGGTRLRIVDSENQELLNTTNTAEIDSGSLEITPLVNTSYTLELTAEQNRTTSSTSVEVVRLRITASGPRSAHPGAPVNISWNMINADPNLHPVIVTPMVEVTGPGSSFYDMDISTHPGVTVIESGQGVTNTTSTFEFAEDFTFDYLGTPMSKLRVFPSGAISFVESTSTLTTTNQVLPNSGATGRLIQLAPFWDLLNTRTSGRVLAARWDQDTYVIQWDRMSVSAGSSDADPYNLNFMVVLRRNGDFDFRYGIMDPPQNNSSGCTPVGCWNEANGSTATIGFQDITGTVGYTLNFSNTASQMKSVAGGLANRTWRYTKATAATGSVEVRPWTPTVYNICVLDPATGDSTCADPVDVHVQWGLYSFSATPWAPVAGEPVTLSWEVEGMDRLRILADSDVILDVTGAAIVDVGSLPHTPTGETTTYTLEATSAGRVVTAEAVVERRPLLFNYDHPPITRYFPGDELTLTWSVVPLEALEITTNSPLAEIDAKPGDPGAYVDISDVGTQLTMSAANGFASFTIPFPFPYFGETYTQALVYVDGYISFDTSGATGVGSNTALPNSGTTQRRIHLAPFWDDLFMRGSDSVWIHSPDPNTFIVQWKNFNRSGGSSAANLYDLNFQVVFYANGAFEYRYGKMAPPPPPFSYTSCYPNTCELEANGSSATIGYQSPDGLIGHQMHFGGNSSSAVVPFEGGLANRSWRYDPGLSGVQKIRATSTSDYSMCVIAKLPSDRVFEECKTVTLRPVADPGDLMFTELMLDPAGGSTEQWFEIRNLTKEPIDLNGFVLRSTRGSHQIDVPLVVAPGAYKVFAASTVPGYTPDRVFGTDLNLHPEVDNLELWAGTMMIASANWDANWTVPFGGSLALDSRYHLAGTVSNPFGSWCDQTQRGPNPGAGGSCQSPYYDVEVMGEGTYYDISDVGTPLRKFETASAFEWLSFPGFNFPIFDTVADSFWVAANGWISFGETLTAGSAAAPSSLPRSGTSQPFGPMIGGFWTTLRCDSFVHQCVFRYHQGEFDGKRAVILDWSGFRYSTTVGSLTFQIQLWEDGDVKVVFDDIWTTTGPGTTGHNNYNGNSATIYMEGSERSDFIVGHLRGKVIDLPYRIFHFKRR